MKAKAAVCREFGRPLQIEEIDISPPEKDEVMVRIAATAICGSDIHYADGAWNAVPPVVLGHESAGRVEMVGEGVTSVSTGQRVAISLIRSCGSCFYCLRGLCQRCEGTFTLQKESRLRSPSGEVINTGVRVGGFAEFVVVHESQVVPLPDSIPFQEAALLTCGVITGVGAVVNTAKVVLGSTVVVIGTGGVGLNIVQGARIAGATVIAIDSLASKREAALRFGATYVAHPQEASQMIDALTHGRGADYVFVATGNAAEISQGLSFTRPCGSLISVGQPPIKALAEFPARAFVIAEHKLMGSLMGSTNLRKDIPWLLDLYTQGRLKLRELITNCYRLEQINEAIAELKKGNAIRNVIVWPE